MKIKIPNILVILVMVFLCGCGSSMHQMKGYSALQAEDYDTAISCYKQALKDDPNDEEVLRNMGEAYLGLRKGPEAFQVLEKVYKYSPYRRLAAVEKETMISFGLACVLKGEYERAIDVWEKYVATDPKSNVAGCLTQQIAMLQDKKPVNYDELFDEVQMAIEDDTAETCACDSAGGGGGG